MLTTQIPHYKKSIIFKSEAIEAAMKSKTMAAAEGNEEYVKMNEEAIKELNK